MGFYLFNLVIYVFFGWMDGFDGPSISITICCFFVDYVVVVSCTLVIELEGSIENNLSTSEGRGKVWVQSTLSTKDPTLLLLVLVLMLLIVEVPLNYNVLL